MKKNFCILIFILTSVYSQDIIKSKKYNISIEEFEIQNISPSEANAIIKHLRNNIIKTQIFNIVKSGYANKLLQGSITKLGQKIIIIVSLKNGDSLEIEYSTKATAKNFNQVSKATAQISTDVAEEIKSKINFDNSIVKQDLTKAIETNKNIFIIRPLATILGLIQGQLYLEVEYQRLLNNHFSIGISPFYSSFKKEITRIV